MVLKGRDVVALFACDVGSIAGRDPGLMEKDERPVRQAPEIIRRHELALPLLGPEVRCAAAKNRTGGL